MPDFKFIKIPNLDLWVINAPKRSNRPDLHGKSCVFCPRSELHNPETYRIGGEKGDDKWLIRTIENKYPFAPIHEVIILTPEHKKSLGDATLEQFKLGVETYVNRYNAFSKNGTVVIFGNSGHDAGESIGHAHAQVAVTPKNIEITMAKLEHQIDYRSEHFNIADMTVMCPPYSQWPDEVWIVPHNRGKAFGDIAYKDIENLAYVWHRLLKIFEIRHGYKFPHNFYIYPDKDWYVRIIPRVKILGGFEIATGIFVNTQDPAETMRFIKDHFAEMEDKKIRRARAKYRKGV